MLKPDFIPSDSEIEEKELQIIREKFQTANTALNSALDKLKNIEQHKQRQRWWGIGSAIFWCLAMASVIFFPIGVTLVVAGIAVPIIEAVSSILSSISLGLYYWRYYAKHEDRAQLKQQCITELHKMHDAREELYLISLKSKDLVSDANGVPWNEDLEKRQKLRDKEAELFKEESKCKTQQGTFRFWGGIFSIVAALILGVGIMFPALGVVVLGGMAIKAVYLAAISPCLASVYCSLGALSYARKARGIKEELRKNIEKQLEHTKKIVENMHDMENTRKNPAVLEPKPGIVEQHKQQTEKVPVPSKENSEQSPSEEGSLEGLSQPPSEEDLSAGSRSLQP